MSFESSKALRRRFVEDFKGEFPWMKLFHGKIIDVGAGDDFLPFDNVTSFDWPQGDANKLSTYFKENTFDILHSSQCLEHMFNPSKALKDWIKVVKPNGHLIITVPDWELYEHKTWPSKTNPDHKSSWSMTIKTAPTPQHVYIPDFLKSFKDSVKVLLSRLVCTNYDPVLGNKNDQTWNECDQVEVWNEFVLQKL